MWNDEIVCKEESDSFLTCSSLTVIKHCLVYLPVTAQNNCELPMAIVNEIEAGIFRLWSSWQRVGFSGWKRVLGSYRYLSQDCPRIFPLLKHITSSLLTLKWDFFVKWKSKEKDIFCRYFLTQPTSNAF